MFTGIIEEVGALERLAGGEIAIRAKKVLEDVALGDSIAVNGVCLTAVALTAHSFSADVSHETLRLTTLGSLQSGDAVNLEYALTLATPLGGHLVSGHVDGVGELLAREADARSERLTFAAPAPLARYIAAKGSITINGVSLTVNTVDANRFSVNIVPHTMSRTTLGALQPGDAVNLEVDLVARYLERLLTAPQENSGGLTLETLQKHGF